MDVCDCGCCCVCDCGCWGRDKFNEDEGRMEAEGVDCGLSNEDGFTFLNFPTAKKEG